MKTVDKNILLDYLAQYGYSLMTPAVSTDPEDVLKLLLKEDDVRLLEGFPVVFFNALKNKKHLIWENSTWRPENEFGKKTLLKFAGLLALTYHLFDMFAVEKKFLERTSKLLLKVDGGKKALENFKTQFLASNTVNIDGLKISNDRLINNFRNYVMLHPVEEADINKTRELELELLLSQLFTPRQKELIRKRLGGKPFSKTEQEYYYRVVKKRLKALASDELHHMAKSLILK